MLFHLIYLSKATRLMSEKDLLEILNESRDWNTAHGITGLLLYVEGNFLTTGKQNLYASPGGKFMQVLEGEETEVLRIFESIQTDARHQDILVLMQGVAGSRDFSDWALGFNAYDLQDYQQLPGYFKLDEDFLKNGESKKDGVALDFLKSFYQMSRSKQ